MAENTGISWADATFNHIIGCAKVSPGCAHCYALDMMDTRYGRVKWGPNGTRSVVADEAWKNPVRWNKKAAANGIRYRVFCASLSDVFEDWDGPMVNHKGEQLFWSHSRKPHESKWHWVAESQCAGGELSLTMSGVRARLFELIDATPHLDWQLLTKRPENIMRIWRDKVGDYIPEAGLMNPQSHRSNVWLGTSVENSDYLHRIDTLKACGDLAAKLFISAEPLLGPMPTIGEYLDGIDWVITGGESGPEARPSHPDWFRSLRDQCKSAEVPFHFKQWGENLPYDNVLTKEQEACWSTATSRGNQGYFGECLVQGLHGLKTSTTPGVRPVGYAKVGVNAAGRLLDGVLHDAFPEVQ